MIQNTWIRKLQLKSNAIESNIPSVFDNIRTVMSLTCKARMKSHGIGEST